MVGARHPQSGEPLHSLPSNQDVLQGVVEGMPHVKDPCHIGRGNHNREGAIPSVYVWFKVTFCLPLGVPAGLYLFRGIDGRKRHERKNITATQRLQRSYG